MHMDKSKPERQNEFSDPSESASYYQIGEFSKLAHVSISKLRYYDKIGLLKPNIRSKYSSYRYYDASQLSRVATIKSFQRHGMPLPQINEMLHNKHSFFRSMAEFSNKKVEELDRQINTLIQMRNEYENLASTYPVLAAELEMKQILYAPIPSYKIIDPNYYEKNIFEAELLDTDSYFFSQRLCKELNSVQWFASDAGYRVDLNKLTHPLGGYSMNRLSGHHPQITSEYMKKIPSSDYLRYIDAMDEADTIKYFKDMLDYCDEIKRIPESYGYLWFMVDDYGDGTNKPIIQLCIPLQPRQ